MARNRSDDTLQGARKLGVLEGQRAIRGRLGVISSSSFDLDDYFSFTLQGRSSFSAALRGLEGNLDLRLRSPDGTQIASSTRRGTRNERISRTLEPGRYIIQVSTDGDTSPYRLILAPSDSLDGGGGGGNNGGGGGGNNGGGGGGDIFGNPTSAFDTDPPNRADNQNPSPSPSNNNFLNIALQSVPFGRALSGTVNLLNDPTATGSDPTDFYRVNVTRSSRIQVRTGNVTGGSVSTDLIFDVNGSGSVDQGDVLITGPDVTKALGAGTYFVGVTATAQTNSSTPISYRVRVDENPITNLNPSADPPVGIGLGGPADIGGNPVGSSPSDLNALGNVTLRQVVSPSDTQNLQLVGTFDSADVYHFRLSAEASNITALINSAQTSGNITMSLVFEDGDPAYGGSYFDDRNGIANPGGEQNGVIGGDFIGGAFTGSSTGGSALAINKTLGAGRYYLIVTQRELTDGSSYTINLNVNNVVTGLSPATDLNSINPSVFPNLTSANGIANTFPNNDTTAGALNISPQFPAQSVAYKQFVGATDGSDYYSFTLTQPTNIIIRYDGTPELVALRFGQDLNGSGILGDDQAVEGVPREVFPYDQPINRASNVIYSPLPPLPSVNFDVQRQAVLTTAPVDIYARLDPGTYYVQIDPQATQVDLGDGFTRYGSANVLYNLAFIVEPPLSPA